MSILKSIAASIVGIIFLVASTTAVIAYSFKDVLQKENLTNFIKTNLTSNLADEQCRNQCNQLTAEAPEAFDFCLQACLENAQNQTENLDSVIDSLYSQPVYGFTLGGLSNFLDTYFIPLIILSILSGAAVVFLSVNPFSKLGHNLISLGITFLAIGLIPNFMGVPTGGVLETATSYFFAPLDDMTKYGIVSLVAGIALTIFGYFHMKKKMEKKK